MLGSDRFQGFLKKGFWKNNIAVRYFWTIGIGSFIVQSAIAIPELQHRHKGHVFEIEVQERSNPTAEIRGGNSIELEKQELERAIVVSALKSALSSILVAAIAAISIHRQVRRPLKDLTQLCEAFARGELDRRAHPNLNGDGEIARLGSQFNEMARYWQDTLESLQNGIAEREETEEQLQLVVEELARTRDEALAATVAKSEFLATMSHEIRTPMNAVIGMTGLLLDTPLNSQQQDFTETIRNSGQALLALINDILDFSKIEAGQMNLEEYPFELRRCIEEALDLVRVGANQKHLKLRFQISPQTPAAIVADVTRIRQILVNLLANAVKFTEVGVIVLSASGRPLNRKNAGKNDPSPTSKEPYEIQFAVRDPGIGIDRDRMHRLFKSFSQVDASTTREYGGTGLGLAISKQLCEMMGGRIWVESGGAIAGNPPPDWEVDSSDLPKTDRGSTFYFTIVAPTAPALAPPPRKEGLTQMRPNRVPLRILLAEDNAVNQKVALLLLEKQGYRADVAGNGFEVLEALDRQSYDVVFMDVQMPKMDGLTATRQICQDRSPDCRPRIIALTANAMGEDRQMCLDAGMDDYLAKPIQVEELVGALSRCGPIETTPPIQTDAIDKTTQVEKIARMDSPAERTPPLDRAILQALRDMAGSRAGQIVTEIVDSFLEDTPHQLRELRAAIETQDARSLRMSAHALRSASANLGAMVFSDLCKSLENLARSGTTRGAERYIGSLEEEYHRVEIALKKERNLVMVNC
ncbi:response regulator [Oscillatoriales cyanobacterium LEGE 11467]|uniref:Circadian input-output histidine kinase CikA n=1 Tax=Zarconia navalis LEGE 11467 TaxID=1828826 RepID=A0A928Z879_9CYAN|nr:response regulator [Zarconia navalis]MBE9042187.1 response regulator [Zarconia navalis LEGE 11467]